MADKTPKQHSTQTAPTQVYAENFRRTPLAHRRIRRPQAVSVVTTSFGGKFVPLKAIGLLREDSIINSRVTLNLQMAETASMLLNPVRVSAMAYFVPKLALPRFLDMGNIDRSYAGEPEVDGQVTPWFEPVLDGTGEFYRTLGLHKAAGKQYNDDYLQSYNVLWNYLAEQRSPSLESSARDVLDETLAPAFWEHQQMKHVKPTFDAALMEGYVPVESGGGSIMTVPGQFVDLPIQRNAPTDAGIQNAQIHDQSDGSNWMRFGDDTFTSFLQFSGTGANNGVLRALMDGVASELQANSAFVSLANIDLARQTQSWARLRAQFQGISEDWMIETLMKGIRIRDETLRHPILIDHSQTIVGMSQRYATDSANLEKSLTDGRTSLQLNINVPQTTCGGVVLICGQVLPEQVYEREQDYYFAAPSVDVLPDRQADELDPQPVEMVRNAQVDTSHTDPDGLFGYAPLNHGWFGGAPNVGGRYYRPDPSAAWDEDRNRIWTPETVDPALGPDFFLSSNLPHDVFQFSQEAPFEWWVNGAVQCEGLTYFGPALREQLGDYDAVAAQVPQDRLAGDGTDVPETPEEPGPA